MAGKTVKCLVLAGDGLNCEQETAEAFRLVGFQVQIRHINDLLAEGHSLDQLSAQNQVLCLPGGFSFGDDLSSGKILALKILHGLHWNLIKFADRGGLVLGICNGFQAMIRMSVFGSDLSITSNQSGRFMNQWVKATPQPSHSLWLKGIGTMDLPIRHGEGRIVVKHLSERETLDRMKRLGMLCLKYEVNPNGSFESLAGLSDHSGRILGMMPHPEAFVRYTAHPEWTLYPDRAGSPGHGLQIFENGYNEARQSL